MKSLLSLSLVTLSLAACLAATGCGVAGSGASQDTIDALTTQVAQLEKQNAGWETRMKKMERQLTGTGGDIASIRNRLKDLPMAAAAGAVAAADAGEDDAVTAALPAETREFAKYLESESGKKALADAVTEANNRQSRERWNRMADGMVDRFAEQANLSEDQSKRMKDLTGTMMSKIGDAWGAMRNSNLSTEERAEVRASAMAQMGELREQLNEDVKLILDADQYSMYEEQAGRMMRGGMGGGRGGRSGGNR